MGELREGDVNSDHVVNGLDFTELVNTFLKSIGETGYNENADFDKNGVVNGLDFTLMVGSFLAESPVEI